MHPKPFTPGRLWVSPSNSNVATAMSPSPDVKCITPESPSDRLDGKPPHDASVFVGSLPCNVDQAELTRLLMEHLSEYADVKSVKVVRDSKGGICAFVQCESADEASNLIQILHAEKPKPFLGRILRFEPARAFRTLLISYRAPSVIIKEPVLGGTAPMQSVHMLDLPTAMRISKAKASRFHNIVYNADAIEADTVACKDVPSTEENSILLHPLRYDEDAVRAIASYFGRVEKAALFQPSSASPEGSFDEGIWKAYPSPHDAPRSPAMHKGCWEVKWDFRDDCVAALMALRRVPHLSVTWAHQPSYSGWECRYSTYSHPPSAFQATYIHPPASLTSLFNATSPTFPGSPPGINTQPRLAPVHTENSNPAELTDVDPFNGRDTLRHSASIPPSPAEHSGWNNIWRPSAPSCSTSAVYPPNPYPAIENRQLGIRPGVHSSAPKLSNSPNPIATFAGPDNDKAYSSPWTTLGEVPIQRDIDPTSLFVGGLEVVGPAAWDEEKIRQYFSQYGGLQNVKFVRPFNAMTGFAFLKFDNVDSPARAVREEHNRIYNGHLLRVRLRDCNPPRNPWKHGGKGRGRSFSHGNGHRKFHFVDRFNFKAHPPHNSGYNIDEGQPSSTPRVCRESSPSQISHTSPSTDGQTLHDETPSPSPSISEKSQNTTSSIARTHEPAERYREWYDDLDASTSASAQSLSASPSMTMLSPGYPYVFPNVPYYGPPPWMQPYMTHQAPYHVPYFNAYPVYPPMMHAPGHPMPGPMGEQDSTIPVPQSWSPQGVIYSSPPYYPFPGVLRQHPLEQDPRHLPIVSGRVGSHPITQGVAIDSGYQMNGSSHLPLQSSSPVKGCPPEPPSNLCHGSPPVSVFPNQSQTIHFNGAPRIFAQPPWNGNAQMMAPPVQLTQAHIPAHQHPYLPHANPLVAEHSAPVHLTRGKRPSFNRREPGFHGNRNFHSRGQNGRVGHGGGPNQSQPVPVNVRAKQPPVWA